MNGRFTVWREKIDVKHWMNAPLRGKFEAIIDRGHHLYDLKGPMSLGRKLGSWLYDFQVAPFKPYLIPDLELGRFPVLYPCLLCLNHQFLCSCSSLFELLYPERHLWNRGRAIHPISSWIISHKEYERGLPCSFIRPIVVYKFRYGNIRDPILLVIVDVEAEVLFHPFIGGF